MLSNMVNFSWNSTLVYAYYANKKCFSKSYSLIAISFWPSSKFVFHFDLVTVQL